VLALPTTALSAPLTAPLEADDRLYDRVDWHVLRNTMFCNQFDLTAISLPLPGCERPVGFMLVARHGQDRRLLEIAAGVERELTG
jgi:aspartyl-tRNA(Asn)/glutamyl-tRNA(Gln) amidotransferase subunit A